MDVVVRCRRVIRAVLCGQPGRRASAVPVPTACPFGRESLLGSQWHLLGKHVVHVSSVTGESMLPTFGTSGYMVRTFPLPRAVLSALLKEKNELPKNRYRTVVPAAAGCRDQHGLVVCVRPFAAVQQFASPCDTLQCCACTSRLGCTHKDLTVGDVVLYTSPIDHQKLVIKRIAALVCTWLAHSSMLPIPYRTRVSFHTIP